MPKLSRSLLNAVQSNDIDALRGIIQEYRRNPYNRPHFEEALCSAVSLGCIDILRLLLRVKVLKINILNKSKKIWMQVGFYVISQCVCMRVTV